jgi:hypothetical protein
VSSGDVALELSSASIVEDDSSRAGSTTTQETKFTATLSGTQAGSYTVELTRVAGSTSSTPETFFDSSKNYKITFTEV